jgi:hypothetical protein
MKRSIIFAVLLAIGATVWVPSGQFGESGAEPQAQKPPADLTALEQAPLVRVRPSRAEQHAVIDLLRGLSATGSNSLDIDIEESRLPSLRNANALILPDLTILKLSPNALAKWSDCEAYSKPITLSTSTYSYANANNTSARS